MVVLTFEHGNSNWMGGLFDGVVVGLMVVGLSVVQIRIRA